MDWKAFFSALIYDLPDSQKIAVQVGGGGCDVGFNLDKLRRAREIFDSRYPDDERNPNIKRVLFLHARQLNRDLCPNDSITVTDYHTLKDLSEGKIDEYLDFKFILTNLLNTNDMGDRQIIVMRLNAIGSCLVIPIGTGKIDRESILEIDCDES